MAKQNELPGFRDKRKTLFGSRTSEQQMLETGRRFAEAQRFYDALEFFERTKAAQEVRDIARHAQESGDTPLFLRAKVVLKEAPTEQELEAVARNAEAAGHHSMALTAYLKAGRTDEADRLRAEMGLAPRDDQEGSSEEPSAPSAADEQEA